MKSDIMRGTFCVQDSQFCRACRFILVRYSAASIETKHQRSGVPYTKSFSKILRCDKGAVGVQRDPICGDLIHR